jgi:hypothetical protein
MIYIYIYMKIPYFSAPKSCPICRVSYARLSQHLHKRHKLFGTECANVLDRERRRHLVANESSHDMADLRKQFPTNYLEVALYLLALQQPVFERSVRAERTEPVRHLSTGDIVQAMQEAKAVRVSCHPAAREQNGRNRVAETMSVPRAEAVSRRRKKTQ